MRTTDPWEQYRTPGVDPVDETEELGPDAAVASLNFPWMPDVVDGRDCSCTLLTRLRSDALLKLRDREQAAEAEDGVAAGEASASPAQARPRRAGGAGKASADKLQELYLKAKLREAEETKRREESAKEERALRRQLAALPAEEIAAACASGWDGMQVIIEKVLGDGSWARAVNSVPDDWEEEEAIDAISQLLRNPTESEYIWLLLERD